MLIKNIILKEKSIMLKTKETINNMEKSVLRVFKK